MGHKLFLRWQGPLTFNPSDYRFKLATLLLAQECAPLQLMHTTAATLAAVTAAIEQLQHNKRKPGDANLPTEPAHFTQTKQTSQGISEDITPPLPKVSSGKKAPPASHSLSDNSLQTETDNIPDPAPKQTNQYLDRSGHTKDDKKHPDQLIEAQATGTQQRQSEISAEAESPLSPSSQSDQAKPGHGDTDQIQLDHIRIETDTHTPVLPQFHTEQGGLLYLLNFLNRPQIQTIMGECWQQLPSGWSWLYRVAKLLNFNDQGAMAQFLAQQIGLDSVEELASLPPLPARKTIEGLALQWYERDDLWKPSLLSLPAMINYSASHVDMHCPLSQVRLELRLAGLDVNPGWLPWLGRVVQFHFDQHGGIDHE